MPSTSTGMLVDPGKFDKYTTMKFQNTKGNKDFKASQKSSQEYTKDQNNPGYFNSNNGISLKK